MVADVVIGGGASVYDMTDNSMLKSLASPDLSIISGLLAGSFAANAANVGFTPVEMAMQGWPWLEAGDALEITAEDGTVVDTYALRIELSGIQKLTAEIVSEGGEIIGEV
jgi:3-isopropylmalate dehydratase small subunit